MRAAPLRVVMFDLDGTYHEDLDAEKVAKILGAVN